MNHFKGKPLTITSDCSYSGNWINDCAKRLDDLNVPSCGHHTREQGLLFQIVTSCQPNEEATALCFINEAVEYSEADKAVIITFNGTLTSGQKSMLQNFKNIHCSKPASESCEATLDCTWSNCLKSHLIYRVRGTDRGRAAWYYVLVDEDKIVDYKNSLKSDTINLENYGTILESGYGEHPPERIEQKIKCRFGIIT